MAPIAPMSAERSSSAAAASASVSGTDEIQENRLALSAVHSASVSLSMRCQAMQCVARQAIAEDVRPGADDLMVDPLFVHPFVAFGHGLDQAREERPHLEAVVEAERLLAAVGGREADADGAAFAFDRGDELRRDVMGVDVDGQWSPMTVRRLRVMPGLEPGIQLAPEARRGWPGSPAMTWRR